MRLRFQIFFRREAGTSCTISCKECISHASKTCNYCQEITLPLLLSITAAVNENLERSLNGIGPLTFLKSTHHISQLADTNISDKFDSQNSSPRLTINVNYTSSCQSKKPQNLCPRFMLFSPFHVAQQLTRHYSLLDMDTP